MKTLILGFLILICAAKLIASNTEPVEIKPYYLEHHSADWYQEQRDAWRAVTRDEPRNGTAWLNRYEAKIRVAGRFHRERVNYVFLEQALRNLNSDSYEYQILRAAQLWEEAEADANGGRYRDVWLRTRQHLYGEHDDAYYMKLLDSAHAIDPSRSVHLLHTIEIGTMANAFKRVTVAAKRLQARDDWPVEAERWAENVLSCVEERAILVAFTDMEALALRVKQFANNYRTDVRVVSERHLKSNLFTLKFMGEEGLKPDPFIYEERLAVKLKALFKDTERSIYVMPTIPKDIRDELKGQLYLVGVALKMSSNTIDNMPLLLACQSEKMDLSYLNEPKSAQFNTAIQQLNKTYGPAVLALDNRNKKVDPLRLAIKEIDRNETSDPTTKYGKEIKHLEMRFIEQEFVEIEQGKLLAGQYEVSNANYERFLIYLLRERNFEALEKAKGGQIDWYSLPGVEGLSDDFLFEHGHPDGPKNPVHSISHEAATMYCEWLTEQYNAAQFKKKKFLRVQFRLPTKEEWQRAAAGGRQDVSPDRPKKYINPYPWGGPLAKNGQGCYLGNFKTIEEFGGDGGCFSVKVDSYWPNDYGCYNMVGNVAEMISEKGKVMGGSWNDTPEESTILSVKNMDTPHYSVGFRVFMEVLEQ